MTSAHLIGLALLLTPLCTVAQQSTTQQPGAQQYGAQQPADQAKATENKVNRQVELAEVEPGVLNPVVSGPLLLPPMKVPDTDHVCFTMRTYVVARDSKDSDSVHPVRYSTCTPANNRGVKRVAPPPVER
jgi:hypothetical protein